MQSRSGVEKILTTMEIFQQVLGKGLLSYQFAAQVNWQLDQFGRRAFCSAAPQAGLEPQVSQRSDFGFVLARFFWYGTGSAKCGGRIGDLDKTLVDIPL